MQARRILRSMDAGAYAAASEGVWRTFVDAFRPYVLGRLAPSDAVLAGVTEGEARLEETMRDWAAKSAREQRASPLELFREALAPPTAAALDAGAEPTERDAAAASTLPGDVLDIAPTTSRDLGEAAWRAHVAWGLARAEAIAGMVPRPGRRSTAAVAALVGLDVMDRTRVQSAADAAGYELLVWRNPGAVAAGLAEQRPALVFLDLAHPAAHELLGAVTASGVPVIAFGPHVDDHALAAARALGARDALPRSRFFRRLGDLFPAVG